MIRKSIIMLALLAPSLATGDDLPPMGAGYPVNEYFDGIDGNSNSSLQRAGYKVLAPGKVYTFIFKDGVKVKFYFANKLSSAPFTQVGAPKYPNDEGYEDFAESNDPEPMGSTGVSCSGTSCNYNILGTDMYNVPVRLVVNYYFSFSCSGNNCTVTAHVASFSATFASNGNPYTGNGLGMEDQVITDPGGL